MSSPKIHFIKNSPYHVKVINFTARDAPHVIDGLLYHEMELQIEEHYTDTAGYTDHVFAMSHLLGFRFAPRIRDLGDKRMYTVHLRKADGIPRWLPYWVGGSTSKRSGITGTISCA